MVMGTPNPGNADLPIGPTVNGGRASRPSSSAPGQTDLIAEIYGLRPSTHEQFCAYHQANPHIYRRLRAMALQLKRTGHDRWGIKNLWEKLRYDLAAAEAKDPNNQFTLNNNYTAFYARRLMRREPELAGFFEIRERQVKK